LSAGTALGVGWARAQSRAAHWRAVEMAIAQRRWEDARALLADWLVRSPVDGKARLLYGGVLDRLGRVDEAGVAVRGVAQSDPNWPRAQLFLGESAAKRHDAVEAERAFRAASAADPGLIDARRRLVFLLGLEQRHDEARDVLSELYRR